MSGKSSQHKATAPLRGGLFYSSNYLQVTIVCSILKERRRTVEAVIALRPNSKEDNINLTYLREQNKEHYGTTI